MVAKQSSGKSDVAVVWFRKCLRLHDNAALVEAVKSKAQHVCPIFIIDPHFGPNYSGVNRYNFLLECLQDLDMQLNKRYGSRLIVLRGKPEQVMAELLKNGSPLNLPSAPRLVLWERDTEPYALKRDQAVMKLAAAAAVEVKTFSGHTIWDVEIALAKNKGKAPISMPSMVALTKVLGEPAAALPVPSSLPPPPKDLLAKVDKDFAIPSLQEMGYKIQIQAVGSNVTKGKASNLAPHCGFVGGETSALNRLAAKKKEPAYIRNFEKPKTKSSAFDPPSTTVLSPYIKFGCLSIRTFYHEIQQICKGQKHSQPPESLLGQIYFREMAYLMGASIPNFDRQVGNPYCKQVPWGNDPKLVQAWSDGKTGYPFIDAAMRQLNRVGWMHHLARHAVACFLTRGDLWQSWESGRDVFDRLLLDADWALNNMNWLALSGASPWSPPFFRVYSPIPTMVSSLNVQDPEGVYVREFVPELRNMPSKYIYAPWTAPIEVQKSAGCIVGKDYPKPIVDHAVASKANIARFMAAQSSKTSAPSSAAGRAKTESVVTMLTKGKRSSTATSSDGPSPKKRKA